MGKEATMSATKLIEPSSFIRVPMVEEEDICGCGENLRACPGKTALCMYDEECAGCGETDCENERCDNPRCEGGCIGSCNCARCDGDFCTNCEIGGDGEDENDWVCDNCVDDLVEEKYEQRCKALGEKPGDDYHVCDNLIHGDCPDGSVWHSDNVLKYNDEDLCLCPKCFFGDERKY